MSRAPDAPAIDGRRRRSVRSRERILDAVEKALANPTVEVTAERVAAEAGVSLSTIFRQFGDLDGLGRAMRQRLEDRVVPIMRRGPFVGDLRARVRDLVDRRNQAFEISGPLRRAAFRSPRPEVRAADREATLRRELRVQLREALGDELAGVGDERAAAVEALLSPQAWDQLRLAQGLEPGAIAATLETAVLALLAES